MKYFPTHTIILENTRIVRDRLLPPYVSGEVLVKGGDQVSTTDVVAIGTRPSDYKIIDVAGALGIHPDDTERLEQIITLKVGQKLAQGDLLGTPRKGSQKRRMPKAPANAIVSLIEHGRVILQINPETIQVLARLPGRVIEIHENWGVTIEAYGTLMQCAWGNGQFSAAPFAFEPSREEGGLEGLLGMDLSLSPFRDKAIILQRPLRPIDLEVIVAQELKGIVAPSAPPHLREKMIGLKVPVILTEGFGNLPPTSRLYDILLENQTAQAIFDAAAPDYSTDTRPEIILPGGATARSAQPPAIHEPIKVGMRVRLRRAPYAGRIGTVMELPEKPIQIENGLRVTCAKVRLQREEEVLVPLQNLENLGEALL